MSIASVGNRIMREKNLFTYTLVGLGALFLTFSLVSIIRSPDLPEILLLSILMSFLGLFPVRLPQQYSYSLDSIVTVYMLVGYHWTSSLFASMLTLFVYFLRLAPKYAHFPLFRLFVTMGMYGLGQWTAFEAYYIIGGRATLFTVIGVVAVVDLSSLVIKIAIQKSILGGSALRYAKWSELLFTFLMIIFTSFIALRLIQAGSLNELVQELIFSAIIIFLFTRMSDLNRNQATQLEENSQMFEEFLDADERLCLQLDRKGNIEFSNSAVELVLGYSREDLQGTSVWEIVATERNVYEAAWHSALEGSRGAVMLTVRCEDGSTKSCKATLLPAVRNKQVTGVYLVVQSYGGHHDVP